MRPVDVDGLGKRRALDDEREASVVEQRLKGAGEPCGERGEIGGGKCRGQPSRFDAREVEQAVDQTQEPERVAVKRGEVFAAERCAGARQRPLHGPRMRVSGVRNSWLTLLKKAVLAASSSPSLHSLRAGCGWLLQVLDCA